MYPAKGGCDRTIPYLLAYLLHTDNGAINAVRATCNATGLRPIFLEQSMIAPSPLRMLELIRGAAYVVTQSFHGLCLAIKFRVPFTALGYHGSHAPLSMRLTSLLSLLGLGNRFIADVRAFDSAAITCEPPEWDKVQNSLDSLTAKSDQYLRESLR